MSVPEPAPSAAGASPASSPAGGPAGPSPRALRALIGACAAGLFAVQLASALAPIAHEVHNWRQADVYSVALNFRDRGLDLLHPRIDFWRGPTQVVGMEAPLMPALAYGAMFVVGEHPRAARLVNVLFGLVAVLFVARTWRPWREDEGLGEACVWLAAALSPMALQELRQIQPDALSAALTLIASALILRASRRDSYALLLGGALVLSLAAVTKSPALTAGPALFLLSWIERPPRWPRVLGRAAAFALPLLATAAWTWWAAQLTREREVLSPYFHLDFTKDEVIKNLTDLDMIKHALAYLLGGYAVSWLLWPSLLAGVALSLRKPERRVGGAMLVWLLGALGFCLAFSFRTTVHLYYAMVLLGPGLFFAGRGLTNLLAPGRDAVSRASAWLVFLCFLPAPYLASRCPRWGDGVTTKTWSHSWFVPEGGYIGWVALILALIFAVAGLGASRRVEGWLAAAALVWGVGWSLPGQLGYFTYATGYKEWRTFDAGDRAMRQAVEAHSTRDDLFFVDGYSPWYLHRARRKGFSIYNDASAGDLACRTPRGVSLYLHYRENGRVTFQDRRLEPIVTAPEFELLKIVPPFEGSCDRQPSLWAFKPALPAPQLWPDQSVRLISVSSSKCMTATASTGASVRQIECGAGDVRQRFRVLTSSTGAQVALDAEGSWCITAADSRGDDHPLTVQPCAGSPAQKVDVKKGAADSYFFAVQGTQNVWDATPFGESGRRVNRFAFHAGPCQQWRVEPLPPLAR